METSPTQYRRKFTELNTQPSPAKSSKSPVSSHCRTPGALNEASKQGLEDYLPDYQFTGFIARGGQGKVFSAIEKDTGRAVAIKQITTMFQDVFTARRIFREVYILKKLSEMDIKHPLLTTLLDLAIIEVEDGPLTIFLIMEYEPMNLRDLLEEEEPLTSVDLRKLLYSFLCGLNFLHSAGLMHRDIKPTNLLVSKAKTVRFCDFGLARNPPQNHYNLKKLPDKRKIARELRKLKKPPSLELSNHVTARWYRAPEIIMVQDTYDEAADLWSAGCVISELICSQDIYRASGMVSKEQRVLFQGTSCFPLSPRGTKIDSGDQMRRILNILGKQDDLDLSFLRDENDLAYVRKLEKSEDKVDFKEEFTLSPPELVEILEKLLQFNPCFRRPASDLIKSKFFDKVRVPEWEKPAPDKITVPLDEPGLFNYETGTPRNCLPIGKIKEELFNLLQ